MLNRPKHLSTSLNNLYIYLSIYALFLALYQPAIANEISSDKFLVGYNEAWFGIHYGTDLTRDFNPKEIENTFTGIQQNGGSIVRLWLFEGRQGLLLDSSQFIQGLAPQFLENLGTVIALARVHNLKVYFTLWDGNEMPFREGVLRNFFFNVLQNKYQQGDAFEVRVLGPLLRLLNQNQSQIYALDLMNEIQAPMWANYWSWNWQGPRQWMRRTTSFVKSISPWLPITVSSGGVSAMGDISNGLFSNLGLDFYDLHFYADGASNIFSVCNRAKADGRKIILGEFGQKTQKLDDELQLNSTRQFLLDASNSCFSAALAWRFDSAEKWWRFLREDGTARPAANLIREFQKNLPLH